MTPLYADSYVQASALDLKFTETGSFQRLEVFRDGKQTKKMVKSQIDSETKVDYIYDRPH